MVVGNTLVDEKKRKKEEKNIPRQMCFQAGKKPNICQAAGIGIGSYKFHLWKSFLYEMAIWQGPSQYPWKIASGVLTLLGLRAFYFLLAL